VRACLDAFEQERGVTTQVTFATAPNVRKAVESGATDAAVVIASQDAVAAFDAAGLTQDGVGGRFGSVAAGVVIRTGATAPDISNVESLKAAIRDADSVVYNIASSGLYIAAMFETLGLTATVEAKAIRPPNGAGVIETLASGDGQDIGFAQIPEIRRLEDQGVTLVGPLPPGVEITTTYGVAALRGNAVSDDAAACANFLASDSVTTLLNAAGVTRQ
jgi:molybdate transport system substrate-binding protein